MFEYVSWRLHEVRPSKVLLRWAIKTYISWQKEENDMQHCGVQMRYQSAELSDPSGVTVHIWNRVCMICGYATKQMERSIPGRGPLSWQDSYMADKAQDLIDAPGAY